MIDLRIDGHVALLQLRRPPVNAWDTGQLDALQDTIATLKTADEVSLVVVRGSGGIFSAGADIKYLASCLERGRPEALDGFARRIQALFNEWAELCPPTVAVIEGLALGGGLEFALACDLRIVSDTARLGFPEVTLGLVPAGGGTQRLTELIGRGEALRMLLTGEPVSGVVAARIGLAQWCCAEGETDAVLSRLASLDGAALAAVKRCAAAAGTPLGYATEIACQRSLHQSEETRARLRDFVSQRGRT